MDIAVLLYPGVDELDAVAPFEVLQMAQRAGAQWEVRTVTMGDRKSVRAANGLELLTDARAVERQGAPNLLIVPGGGWNNRAPEGAWGEVQRGAIPTLLRELHGSGTILASVCTGAMLLAAAGLLKGRNATTHHLAFDALGEYGAVLTHGRVVDDGEIITAGGVTSGLDLALWIVERFASREIAAKIEDRLEYQRRGPIWVNEQRGAIHEDVAT